MATTRWKVAVLFVLFLASSATTSNADNLFNRAKKAVLKPPKIEDPVERIGKEFEKTRKDLERIAEKIKNLDPDGVSEELWGEAGRVAYTEGAKTMAGRSPHGDKLSGELAKELRRHFGDLVGKVRIHWGVEPLDEWAAARFKVRFPGGANETEAQTFGYNIYVKYDRDAKPAEYSFALIGHELVHSKQFKRYHNSYSDFGYHYFKEYKRANKNYENNKLEREANEIQEQITPLWGKAPVLQAEKVDIDGPEKNGDPSQVAIAVDGDQIYWVTAKGRFRRGKLTSEGKLKAVGPDIDGPEKNGDPSQVAIAVDEDQIYWVTAKGRFRRGKLTSEGKLKAVGPDIDGPEKNGDPSQVAIAVDGDQIYWVTAKGRFRRGKLNSEGKLRPVGSDVESDIDGPEDDGSPSQIAIAVEGNVIYWVTSDGRFRRGKLTSEGNLRAIGADIAGRESDGSPSQLIIAGQGDTVYWVNDSGQFRRGTVR